MSLVKAYHMDVTEMLQHMETDGLKWLATDEERAERNAALEGLPMRIQLQYLQGSEKMGRDFGIDCRLWNVLSPQLSNYPTNGGANGWPTLGLDGLKAAGLI